LYVGLLKFETAAVCPIKADETFDRYPIMINVADLLVSYV